MNTRPGLMSLMTALVIGLCLHAACAWAEEGVSTPDAVAKKFTQAYYMLDSGMADFLSTDALTNENDVNMVDLFLRVRQNEALNRGYQLSYLQMYPILIKAEVTEVSEETATVEVKTTALRSINPLYRMVGYVFGLIQEHDFDTTLTLVKEDGEWKVGPGALAI